ncbi:uncharacterized protein LOC116255496 [Nymphaea colorata]|nr:uncharacterized protein LOC116255496 [Nymphaea colorata]
MSIVSEITSLLKLLASQLKERESYESYRSGSLDASTTDEFSLQCTSSLNRSLNFTGRSELLDAALSILCYQASDVYSSTSKFLVDTLVAVLRSSISCKSLSLRPHYSLNSREPTIELQDLQNNVGISKPSAGVRCSYEKSCLPKEEILQIGLSISADDFIRMVEACLEILLSLDHHGDFSHLLFHAILKVATSVSCYKIQFPSSTFIYERLKNEGTVSVSSLQQILRNWSLKENYNTECRQLVWYLDPLSLREEISSILRHAVKRPFLSLRKALHEKEEWRSVVLTLVSCPVMFIETRSLLNNWFLLTGLNSVLLLRIQLVSSLLDMLARPTFWGLPMDLGLMLPFAWAFFPGKQKRMVALLAGPVSCKHFQEIVHLIGHANASTYFDSSGTAILVADDSMAMDHSSAWSMLLDFPIWFHFAAMLLFRLEQCQDKLGPLEFDSEMNISEQYVSELRCSAAIYLGWVLSPTNSTCRNMMVLLLKEASVSWMKHRKFNTDVLYVCAGSRHPSLERKSGAGDFDKVCMASANKKSMMSINSWLKEFQTLCINCYNRSGFSGFSSTNEELHAFLRKILLGIFTGNISTLDCSECEVLFHYVSSGQILAAEEVIAGDKIVVGRLEDHEHIQRKCSWEKIKVRHVNWIQITVFMFDLFDILEDMIPELLEYENGVKYISQAKAKSVRYLTNCISKILQANDLHEVEMLIDLKDRFLGWMQQGSELFDGYDECNELALILDCKISSMQQV